jgi:hypothetical protein
LSRKGKTLDAEEALDTLRAESALRRALLRLSVSSTHSRERART